MHLEVPVILFLVLKFSAGANYEGSKVYKVFSQNEDENAFLRSLESNPNFDFWSKVNKIGKPVMVMVTPESQKAFEQNLNTSRIKFGVHFDNIEEMIQAEREYHKTKKSTKLGSVTFDQYLRHAEINAYLDQLAQKYPDTVSLETIGQSFENRDLKIIRISSGARDPPKPAIFIDGGIHAREWIAPAVAVYIVNQLVENPDNSDLIQDVDWIILPVVNPDGYEFCWDTDRFWRKTVSKGASCDGCDANRNFDYHWMEVGASKSECSDIYAGKEAFSESETRSLAKYLTGNDNIVAYLTLHSFGQYLLYPWGYIDALCDNWEELDKLGREIASAIKAVRGTEYTVGGTTATLYAAAGASDDWAKGVPEIDIVYTMELPGDEYGFELPAGEILPVGRETFEGVKVLGYYVAENKQPRQ